MNKKVFARLITSLAKIKPLHPLLEPYLWKNMVSKYCKKNDDLHIQDKVVDKGYFIGSGFIVIYYVNDGKRNVFRICGQDEIVAGKSFMSGDKSEYYLKAAMGTYLLVITAKQMKEAYRTVNETEEHARLVISSFERKELKRDSIIRKRSEESVLYLYTTFPGLLPPGKVILDADIASYLHIGVTALKRHRKALKAKGLI